MHFSSVFVENGVFRTEVRLKWVSWERKWRLELAVLTAAHTRTPNIQFSILSWERRRGKSKFRSRPPPNSYIHTYHL